MYSFALPVGAQLNKDGTSVMLGAVLLFTAQAAGVAFAPADFVTILLLGLLLSHGTGGVPGGGFVVALVYVQALNLPIEVAAIVGGHLPSGGHQQHDREHHGRHGRRVDRRPLRSQAELRPAPEMNPEAL